MVLSWSGGKDSALALWALQRDAAYDVRALLTTVTEGYGRISMHGVRRDLLRAQAASTGLPLVEASIPPECPNDVYEQRMGQALTAAALQGIDHVAYGDLFLEDIRNYREAMLAAGEKQGVFPLWGRDTRALAGEFLDAAFRAYLVCVDPKALDPSFAGRAFDRALLRDLPPDVDPCGENGEFHTFVWDGPVFRSPVPCRPGDVVHRDGFVYCDLLADPPESAGTERGRRPGASRGSPRRSPP